MAPLIRALTYATVFVGFVLVWLPAQLLEWSGMARPVDWGPLQWFGVAVTGGGAAVVLWCVLTFAVVGRGTPAPFDPPRRLIVSGPYRFVRNPMYIGAASVLAGAALFYRSLALFGFVLVFLLITHLFVVLYEEPTLHRTFADEYGAYCRRVRRWLPSRSGAGPSS